MRLTGYRKEILEIVTEVGKPLTAKTISEKMKSTPNLSTIYRALDYLESEKIIKSIYFSDDSKYYFLGEKHSHYLFCEKCSDVKEFDICYASKIEKNLEMQFNYKITGHCLYFTGICSECQKI